MSFKAVSNNPLDFYTVSGDISFFMSYILIWVDSLFFLVRLAKMTVRVRRNWNSTPLLVGLQISTTSLENSMEDPQKNGN